jgi:protein SCO1/2
VTVRTTAVVRAIAEGLFGLLIPLIVAIAGSGCGGHRATEDRTYTLQGQVVSVARERNETLVKHEAIAGFMNAMTMPYFVREPKEIVGLQPGDLITSTLVVEASGSAYLRDVRIVGDAPLERPSSESTAGTSATTADARASTLLNEGDAVPNTTLVDQDGKPREFSSFRGSTLVVTFIYTSCPLPTFCPMMDRHFATLHSKLAEEPALKSVQLVTISFDPTTDTPEVLKRHATTLGADPTRWTFFTGEHAAIEAFARRFGVFVVREQGVADITHNLRTAIVDKNGLFVKAYSGNDWTPAQLLADLVSLER